MESPDLPYFLFFKVLEWLDLFDGVVAQAFGIGSSE